MLRHLSRWRFRHAGESGGRTAVDCTLGVRQRNWSLCCWKDCDGNPGKAIGNGNPGTTNTGDKSADRRDAPHTRKSM
jgi:hypothetical protein